MLLTKQGVEINNLLIEGDKPLSIKDWYESLLILGDDAVDTLCFFDTETSHLNGYAVSLAMLKTNKHGEITDKFYSVYNPQVRIDEETIKIHGITQEEAERHGVFDVEEVEKFLEDVDCMVAYNTIYDLGILINEYMRSDKIYHPVLQRYIDIMDMAKITLKLRRNIKLSEVAKELGVDIEGRELHNALDDTMLLLDVYKAAIS